MTFRELYTYDNECKRIIAGLSKDLEAAPEGEEMIKIYLSEADNIVGLLNTYRQLINDIFSTVTVQGALDGRN